MPNTEPHSKIQITIRGESIPFMRVPVSELSRVRDKLDRHIIRYWVEAHSISIGGKPPIAFINLYPSEDPKKVQAILDDDNA